MTSKPASRSARATIFAPRSCPSSPGLATTTRTFLSAAVFTRALLCSGEGGADAVARLRDRVPVPRYQLPVEPLAVVGPARDQVKVKVRHRLERGRAVGLEQVQAVGRERLLDRPGDPLGRCDRSAQVGWIRLEERGGVPPGHDETVAGIDRVDVHERERALVLVDLHRRDLPVADLAEHALHGSDLDGPAVRIRRLAILDAHDRVVQPLGERADLAVVDYHPLALVGQLADGRDDGRRTGAPHFLERAAPVRVYDVVDGDL